MKDVCGGNKPYLGTGHLEAEHLRIKDKAIFQVKKKSIIKFDLIKRKLKKKINFIFDVLVYINKKNGWRRVFTKIFGSINDRFG